MNVKELAYKYAIKNAFLHKGKADTGAIIGKIAALGKQEKGFDLKKAMPVIQQAVEKVNSLSLQEIEKEFKRFEEEGYELKAREKKEGLPELDWAEKEGIVTRFAPNPNGPFHLGNARAAILSYKFAEEYKGRFLLRFDDTDPKVKKPIENAEGIFKEDLDWLNCKVDETYFASDRMELYYRYMKKLLKMEKAYVCICEQEKWRKLVREKKPCPCREREGKEHFELFEKMLKHELKEGEAVLRIKTELEHKDPSIRDWWAARIVDEPKHVRLGEKYVVWPSYNFASAIDDHELGVTLIIRGQEHEQNKTKQEFVYKYLKWNYPHIFHIGRIALQGVILSTSKIKEGIESGKYIGWDDPRLGTIRALRRRGFKAEALVKALLDLGVKSSDSTIEWASLIAENKRLIEAEAEELMFIQKPVYLTVELSPRKVVEVHGQEIELQEGTQRFVVDKDEIEKYGIGKVVRLRNAYNVKIKGRNEFEVFAEYVGDAKIREIIHWLLEGVDVSVMMEDGKELQGLAEERILNKKVNEYCYLERFGFTRIDSVERERIKCWFTHK